MGYLTLNTRTLTLLCPSRLAFGLANLSGSYNGIDGGVGVGCTEPNWLVKVAESKENTIVFHATVDEELKQKAEATVARLKTRFQRDCQFEIYGGIPQHIGLGSTTSLLSGLYLAFCSLHEFDPSLEELGLATKRGGTSGIGCNVAIRGGWIWDLGHRTSSKKIPAPSSASLASPPMAISLDSSHKIEIVHFSFGGKGLHGQDEISFFIENGRVDESETKDILAIIAGGVLPSISYGDIKQLNQCIGSLQTLGLKRAEWGVQDNETKSFRASWPDIDKRHAIGLSSMGPTMYILTDDAAMIIEKIALLTKGHAKITQSPLAAPLEERLTKLC